MQGYVCVGAVCLFYLFTMGECMHVEVRDKQWEPVLPTMQVPQIEVRLSSLVAGALIC